MVHFACAVLTMRKLSGLRAERWEIPETWIESRLMEEVLLKRKILQKEKKQRDKHMLGSLLFVFNGYLMYGYSLRCMQQRQKPVRLVLQ